MLKKLKKPLAGINKTAQTYALVNEITNVLESDPIMREIFGPEIFEKNTILHNINGIQSTYINRSIDFLVDEFHKRDSSWSKASIRNWLRNSPRDVKFTEQLLEYMGDSHVKVLAMTANVVMEAEHANRRTAIEFNKELQGHLEEIGRAHV